MVETAVEEKTFKMHKKLLVDVIKNQAGTLEKAILEGIMNSVEAGSRKILINFSITDDNAHISLIDDGIGIQTEEEIIEHFETFGTPHNESEHKIYARYRMGRGQLFAFGKNVWRTSTFRMTVDIDNWGLIYKLEKDLPEVKGCRVDIDLYKNPIGGWAYHSLNSFKDALKKQIEFIDCPVFFNDEQISIPPGELTWDEEDEYAYYTFGVGMDLKIYNIGAFVKSLSASSVGTVGIIVSKQQLDVNFARNDVQSTCKIYAKIQDVIAINKVKKIRKKTTRLSSYERQSLLKDLRDEQEEYKNIKSKKIILTSQGKYISLNQIRNNTLLWTFAPDGDRLADRLMQQGRALCISDDILLELNYKGEKSKFFSWLVGTDENADYITDDKQWEKRKLAKKFNKVEKLYIPYGKPTKDITKCLTDGFSEDYSIVAHEKMTIVERRVIKVLQGCDCWNGRIIRIGLSDCADAWTDGKYYIAIDRKFLKGLCLTYGGNVAQLFETLKHEMAHDEDTDKTHIHSPEFYENYHHISFNTHKNPCGYISQFIQNMKRCKIDEKVAKVRANEEKEKEKKEKKLGIAASSK